MNAIDHGDRRYVGSACIKPDYVAGQPLVYEAELPRALLVSLSFRRARQGQQTKYTVPKLSPEVMTPTRSLASNATSSGRTPGMVRTTA